MQRIFFAYDLAAQSLSGHDVILGLSSYVFYELYVYSTAAHRNTIYTGKIEPLCAAQYIYSSIKLLNVYNGMLCRWELLPSVHLW